MAAKISRQSAELDFEIDKGSTFRHQITWKTGLEGQEVAVDLTGCTARMHIREDIDATIIEQELTTENGGITLGGILGTVDLYISDLDSTAFTIEKGVYGLEIIFPNTDVRRLLRGKIKVFNEVTR